MNRIIPFTYRIRKRPYSVVLYPLLRVEIPEIKIERVGDLPPGLFGPVSMEPLDLEIDSHLGSLATAKGDGLAKLAPQLPSFQNPALED